MLTSEIRKRDINLSSYTFGKIPPQAKDLEEVVLGAMMLDSSCVHTVIGILRSAEVFYVNAHQLVYSAIVRLFGKNSPVDLLTVTEELKKMGSLEDAGGPFAVSELCNRVASSAHVESHARIILEKWIQRERIRLASTTITNAYEDTDDAISGIGEDVNKFGSLLHDLSAGQSKSFGDSVDAMFHNIAVASSKSEDERMQLTGISTGNYQLDRLTRFRDSNFIIIAGRPGDGKTSLAVNTLLVNASRGVPMGMFSLEMPAVEIIQKITALHTGISVKSIINGRLSKQEFDHLAASQDYIRSLPIKIYDKGGLDATELSAVAKGWKAKFGIKGFIIDYLQLMKLISKGKHTTREQEVSEISRGCKELAKALDAPVIGISALSRNLEQRSGWERRPKDSDLREGGSLEFDADVIIYVFRPENHGLDFFSKDGKWEDGASTTDVIEFIVSKNKLGERGHVRQVVNNGTANLVDYAPGFQQERHRPAKINPYEVERTEETPF